MLNHTQASHVVHSIVTEKKRKEKKEGEKEGYQCNFAMLNAHI